MRTSSEDQQKESNVRPADITKNLLRDFSGRGHFFFGFSGSDHFQLQGSDIDGLGGHSRLAFPEVAELTDEQYIPDCCTPLYDAMGQSLNALRPKVAADDRVLVTVVTDGMENSSKEYTGKAIKALVGELKAKGWVFAYIGANYDVEQAAATISIHNTMSFNATVAGTAQMSKRSNSSRSSFFDRIAHNIFDSEVENQCFFDDDK